MARKFIVSGMYILLIGSFFLAACASTQTPTTAPTFDQNLVYTQAAQTVQAGIQMTEEKRPSPTTTATLAPTNTPAPTQEVTPTPTTAQAGAGDALTPTTTTTPLVNNLQPTATAGSGAAAQPNPSVGDKCEYVDQSPKDGTKINKNATWDMTFIVKNIGTTTWDTKYALKFFAGERLNSPGDFYIQKEVKPGELYSFVFPLKAPDSTGEKETIWVVQNPNAVNFCTVFLKVEIVN